jgi:hypothetical protein
VSGVPKGVIVLLVVVAVVFFVVVAMGAGQGEGSPDQASDPPGIVDALGNLGGGRQLRIGEDGVQSDCEPGAGSEAVVVSASCAITVPARGRFSRPLQAGLTPQSGSSIHVEFTPNEGRQPDGKNAPGDARCLALAVDRHGGVIGLSCSGGGQCPVSLRAEGCTP